MVEPVDAEQMSPQEIVARIAKSRESEPIPGGPLPRPAALPPMSEHLAVKRLGELLPLPSAGHGPSRTPGKAKVWRLLDTAVGGVLHRRHAREDQALAALADATAELGTRLDALSRTVEQLASLVEQRLALVAVRLDRPSDDPATGAD